MAVAVAWPILLACLWGQAPDSTSDEAGEPVSAPVLEEHSAIPDRRFLYRGTSLGFGARFITPFYCGEGYGTCAVTPVVGFTSEVGWRRTRLLFDLYTAPAPVIDYDFIIFNFLTANVGVAVGNESYRGSLLLGAGLLWYGAELRGLVAPWRGRDGGRHGLELAVGWGLIAYGTLTLSYRWFPPLLNLSRHARSPATS